MLVNQKRPNYNSILQNIYYGQLIQIPSVLSSSRFGRNIRDINKSEEKNSLIQCSSLQFGLSDDVTVLNK